MTINPFFKKQEFILLNDIFKILGKNQLKKKLKLPI